MNAQTTARTPTDVAAAMVIDGLRGQRNALVAALRNMVGAFDYPRDERDDSWWNIEGLSRYEGTGKSSGEIRSDVLNEARAALAMATP